MIAAPAATPTVMVHFAFEGHAVEMTAAAAWDRAQNVLYRSATQDQAQAVRAYLRLGEWLCGLRQHCTDRFETELEARGMNRSRCYRAMRIWRKSGGGELDPVLAELKANGREPSVRAVLGRLATPRARSSEDDSRSDTRLNVSRATHDRGTAGASANFRSEPELNVSRATHDRGGPGGFGGFGGFGDLDDDGEVGGVAVGVLPAVRLAPGVAAVQAKAVAVGVPGAQLGLADLYAEAGRVRDKFDQVGRLLKSATEAAAMSVAGKVHRVGELLEEIERDLAR